MKTRPPVVLFAFTLPVLLTVGRVATPFLGAAPAPAVPVAVTVADFRVGDIVEVGTAAGYKPTETAVCRVIEMQANSPRYRLRMLQLPNMYFPGVETRDLWNDGANMRLRSAPYSDDWNPTLYVGAWNVGATTRTNTDTGYDGRNTTTVTAGGGVGTLTIRADNTYHWVIAKTWQVRGRWAKSDIPGAAMVLKKAKMDWDYYVYPHHRDAKGRVVIGLRAVDGGSNHSGDRIGAAPTVQKVQPPKASASRSVAPADARVSPKPSAPPAPVPAKPARTYQAGESVDVFQGVGWKKATILAPDGAGYRVTYGDRGYTPDEVAEPLRLRPADSPAVGEVRVGDRVEVLHRLLNDRYYAWPATVLEVTETRLHIRCEAPKGMDYETHYVQAPERRMESNIVRILSRQP